MASDPHPPEDYRLFVIGAALMLVAIVPLRAVATYQLHVFAEPTLLVLVGQLVGQVCAIVGVALWGFALFDTPGIRESDADPHMDL